MIDTTSDCYYSVTVSLCSMDISATFYHLVLLLIADKGEVTFCYPLNL